VRGIIVCTYAEGEEERGEGGKGEVRIFFKWSESYIACTRNPQSKRERKRVGRRII
jgi:hypothetical protein